MVLFLQRAQVGGFVWEVEGGETLRFQRGQSGSGLCTKKQDSSPVVLLEIPVAFLPSWSGFEDLADPS